MSPLPELIFYRPLAKTMYFSLKSLLSFSILASSSVFSLVLNFSKALKISSRLSSAVGRDSTRGLSIFLMMCLIGGGILLIYCLLKLLTALPGELVLLCNYMKLSWVSSWMKSTMSPYLPCFSRLKNLWSYISFTSWSLILSDVDSPEAVYPPWLNSSSPVFFSPIFPLQFLTKSSQMNK